MSRWKDTCILISASNTHQDSRGAWVYGEQKETHVFCNRFSMSLTQSANALDMGLRDTCRIQVRSCDYDGQDKARFLGKEYEIVDVATTGENTTLTLGHRIGNL